MAGSRGEQPGEFRHDVDGACQERLGHHLRARVYSAHLRHGHRHAGPQGRRGPDPAAGPAGPIYGAIEGGRRVGGPGFFQDAQHRAPARFGRRGPGGSRGPGRRDPGRGADLAAAQTALQQAKKEIAAEVAAAHKELEQTSGTLANDIAEAILAGISSGPGGSQGKGAR